MILITVIYVLRHIKFAFVKDDGAKRSNGGAFCSLGNGDQHAVIRLLMPSNLTKKLFDFEIDSVQYKFSAKICMVTLKCQAIVTFSGQSAFNSHFDRN